MPASGHRATAARPPRREARPRNVPLNALDVVAPVFILVGAGWAAAAFGVLSRGVGEGLVAFVFTAAVPVLLARTLITGPPFDGGVVRFYAAYFGGVACVWALAAVLVGRVWGRGARSGAIAGVAAGFSNIVLMGIPTIALAFGQAGSDVLFLLLAVHLPVMVAAATFHMEFAQNADLRASGEAPPPVSFAATARSLARSLSRNPLVIGIAVGAAWRLSGLPFPGLADRTAGLLAGAAGPVALFALGMSMVKYRVRGQVGPAVLAAALSLLALPALVWLFGTWLALSPLTLQVAVVAASMPTGVNAYLFATYFKVAEGLAASAIVLATAGALVTAPLWLWLIG